MLRKALCSRTLEHRKLPFGTRLIQAQNIQIAVVAFELEIAIVGSVPLIDVVDDFDGASTEPKSLRHFNYMRAVRTWLEFARRSWKP